MTDAAGARAARAFNRSFLAASAALAAFALLAALLLDPFGASPLRLPLKRALMDQNQRYMYPQIVKSRAFDSAVFGTSTIRLIDPARLSEKTGWRFAMLGINAGTAREQVKIAEAFRRETTAARMIVWSIDTIWCEPSADPPRSAFTRVFPDWFWGTPRLRTYTDYFSMRAAEISGRIVLHALGRMPERIRADGYEIFTLPESAYDPARARKHLWGGGAARAPDETVQPGGADSLIDPPRMPALELLGQALALFPEARKVLVFPPLHISALPARNPRKAALLELCKSRAADIARKHGAVTADFMIESAVTREDSNYWDPMHYRLPVAAGIADAIVEAAGGKASPDGLYRIR